ncbi:helix-turn-helix domain-containing protein [Actinomadura macra]|uniref:helix-turn-helix domain-containing protein n=1 Tax=Actinomadura macra TaxID=46164 RepID=UPI00082C3C7E|nr:helix-turn-helix transcriptional regulator [Actinomadura macra]
MESTDRAAFCEMLRGLIEAREGMSQRKLAKLTHYDDGYISRVVNGYRRPSAEVVRALDDALDAGGRLIALAPEAPPRTTSKTAGYEATAPLGILNLNPAPYWGDDDMRRRTAVQVIAAFGAGTALPPHVIESVFAGIEDALGNPFDIAEWERVVHRYGLQLLAEPAGSLISGVAADITALGELLKRAGSASEKAELFRIGAGLSALLAMDLCDFGDKRSARVSWTNARRLADASGDRDLSVWTRAREAQYTTWSEHSDAIVEELTGEAIGLAKGSPSSGLARAYAARSYVAAERGDRRTARAALSNFRQTFNDLPSEQSTSAAVGLPESKLFWTEAYVRVLIDDDQAKTYLDQAQTSAVGAPWNEGVELMRSLWLVQRHDISTGLELALSKLKTRPLSSFRRHLVSRIVNTLPQEGRAHPDARALRVLASAA